MFVYFINDLEMYSKWEYSGESELLMLEYKEGILSFDNIMQFYLDKMMRDKVIDSIPSFFQQLLRICKKFKALKDISNAFGRDKLIQVTKENILIIFHQVWQRHLYRENISVFKTMENELYTIFKGMKWNSFMNKIKVFVQKPEVKYINL